MYKRGMVFKFNSVFPDEREEKRYTLVQVAYNKAQLINLETANRLCGSTVPINEDTLEVEPKKFHKVYGNYLVRCDE